MGTTIDNNVVLNTGTTSTDTGSIYVLGRADIDTDTLIANNYVSGTGGEGQHSVAIYLDDDTSGVTVTGNIATNVGSNAVEVHGGHDDTLVNNIFDLGSSANSAVFLQGAPGDPTPASSMYNDTITGNIITSAQPSQTAYQLLDAGDPTIKNNLYYDSNGSFSFVAPLVDIVPQFGNPDFVAPAAANYALGAGSAAALIGFTPIAQSMIGLSPTTAHAYT
jgi:hypothetical protein